MYVPDPGTSSSSALLSVSLNSFTLSLVSLDELKINLVLLEGKTYKFIFPNRSPFSWTFITYTALENVHIYFLNF